MTGEAVVRPQVYDEQSLVARYISTNHKFRLASPARKGSTGSAKDRRQTKLPETEGNTARKARKGNSGKLNSRGVEG